MPAFSTQIRPNYLPRTDTNISITVQNAITGLCMQCACYNSTLCIFTTGARDCSLDPGHKNIGIATANANALGTIFWIHRKSCVHYI